jgi:uncharacterized protein
MLFPKKNGSQSLKRYGTWALVTGASSGIGRAMAHRLSSDGLNCVIVSNERAKLSELAMVLSRTYGTEAVPCYCDLSDPDHLDVICRFVGNREIDVLVNCASFGILGHFLDTPLSVYRAGLGVSVYSYLTLTHHYLQGMIARDRGAVIFVCSVNAFAPVAFSAVYTAEKAFELFLGESLWQELRYARSNVDVLTMCASATKTNFQARAKTRIVRWAWTPQKAVETGLRALGKTPVIALSWRGNVYRYAGKFLPERLRLRFASWAITANLAKDRKALLKTRNHDFTATQAWQTGILYRTRMNVVGKSTCETPTPVKE